MFTLVAVLSHPFQIKKSLPISTDNGSYFNFIQLQIILDQLHLTSLYV